MLSVPAQIMSDLELLKSIWFPKSHDQGPSEFPPDPRTGRPLLRPGVPPAHLLWTELCPTNPAPPKKKTSMLNPKPQLDPIRM